MSKRCASAFLALVLPVIGGCGAGSTTSRAGALISEREIVSLVNYYRQSRGLKRLQWDPQLAGVARAHSRAMAEGRRPFSHAGLEMRAQAASLREPLHEIGENLVALQSASELGAWRALQAWLKSAGHRATLEGCYNKTGVGVASSRDGTVYYTQLFARRPTRSSRDACGA